MLRRGQTHVKVPPTTRAPDIEELLDFRDDGDDPLRMPNSAAAIENVKVAYEKILAQGMDPK